MGKCAKCGKKIQYNSYKVINGVVYCLNCKPEERISKMLADTVSEAKLDFDEFQGAMNEVSMIVLDEAVNVPKNKKPKKRKRSKKSRK